MLPPNVPFASSPSTEGVPRKRLLLLFTTTGYNAQDFVAAAAKLDIELVFGTDRCHVLDDPWRDGAIPVHFHRPAQAVRSILERLQSQPIHGVVAIGDKATLVAAFVSKALGLPHNSLKAVQACRNKFYCRRLFQKAGLPVPGFRCYGLGEDPAEIARHIRFPCVLKPLSRSASQGVIRADSILEFEEAFRRICTLLRSPEVQQSGDSSNEHILVEDFIEGFEVALEGILRRGELRVLALFDKPDPLNGPFFEETLYVTPSRLPHDLQREIELGTQQAADVLGITEGPIHAELRITSSGPRILEVAARSIGGLCSRTLRFGTGMSLEEIIMRHALDLPGHVPQREQQAAGVMMIPIPKSGFLERVTGLEAARVIAGIEEVTITAKLGQKLVPLPEGSSYLGFIFSRGETPASVETALRRAHQQLHFDILPSLEVVLNQ